MCANKSFFLKAALVSSAFTERLCEGELEEAQKAFKKKIKEFVIYRGTWTSSNLSGVPQVFWRAVSSARLSSRKEMSARTKEPFKLRECLPVGGRQPRNSSHRG